MRSFNWSRNALNLCSSRTVDSLWPKVLDQSIFMGIGEKDVSSFRYHLEWWKLSRKWHIWQFWHVYFPKNGTLFCFSSKPYMFFFLSFLLIVKFRIHIWSLNTPYLTNVWASLILMFYFLKIFNFELYVSLSGLDIQYLGKNNISSFGRVHKIVFFN